MNINISKKLLKSIGIKDQMCVQQLERCDDSQIKAIRESITQAIISVEIEKPILKDGFSHVFSIVPEELMVRMGIEDKICIQKLNDCDDSQLTTIRAAVNTAIESVENNEEPTSPTFQNGKWLLKDALKAVKKNGLALKNYRVGHGKESIKLTLAAVKQNGLALKYASGWLSCNVDIVFAAVEQNGLAFEYVSSIRRDQKVILAAVNQNIEAFKYISRTTPKEGYDALSILDKYPRALKYAGRNFTLYVVSRQPLALQYASEESKNDKDVVLAAAKKDIESLQYASEELRKDKEFLLEVLNKGIKDVDFLSGWNFADSSVQESISEELRKNDKGVFLAGLKKGLWMIDHSTIHKLIKDQEVILAAVKKDGLALQYADEDLKKDEEIVLAAVKQNGLALQYAHKDLRKNKKVVLAAVEQNGLALEYASERLKNDTKIVLAAVNQDERALQYAGEKATTDVIRENWKLLEYASFQSQHEEKNITIAAKGGETEEIDYSMGVL